MQIPLQISWRNIEPSDVVDETIRGHLDKLGQFFDRIHSCRVAVERPHNHHEHGNQFHVRVELHVPGKELVASRDPDGGHRHEDVYVTIRDAFDSVRRQLQHYVARLRSH